MKALAKAPPPPAPKRRRRFTAERLAEAKDMQKHGLSIEKISQKLDWSQKGLTRALAGLSQPTTFSAMCGYCHRPKTDHTVLCKLKSPPPPGKANGKVVHVEPRRRERLYTCKYAECNFTTSTGTAMVGHTRWHIRQREKEKVLPKDFWTENGNLPKTGYTGLLKEAKKASELIETLRAERNLYRRELVKYQKRFAVLKKLDLNFDKLMPLEEEDKTT